MGGTRAGQGWLLETERTAYAFGVNAAGRLAHRYWGPRLPYLDDYPPPPEPREWSSFNPPAQYTPEEYPGWGGMSYTDPCLKVTFADGTRDLLLRVTGAARVEGATPGWDIALRDDRYPLGVTLHYRAHPDYDLIERWATVRNDGEVPIAIERAFSAQWHLPRGDGCYYLTHLAGRWSDEFRLQRQLLTRGIVSAESRRLTTSHQGSPWFALDRGAGEERGEVWFGALAWSGTWKLSVETNEAEAPRIGIGVNDWDFTWRLEPGTEFVTPPCYAGYSDGGFGAASRTMHDFVRERLLPHGPIAHKVLYNSWEATAFAVDERSQIELARRAARLGVELFVVDDGWFHGRRDETAGLGDWWPDETKFPRGLGSLIAEVNALGMDFGLWVEPEMVSPDSDLYRSHPDWTIHFPTRKASLGRSQLILNLGRPDVQAYLIESLDRLLEAHNIAFIKWDMNRNVSEPGWPDAPGDPREIWVRYVQGLYRVWGTLRERHPAVIWQSCAGGGGRADLGILRLADQIWTSDNTSAIARLPIQEGFSRLFPANTMEAWVTDAEASRVPLRFRFHVAMCGSLGIGANLLRWGLAEQAEATALLAAYKEARQTIQLGDQYRLLSPWQGSYAAVLYVAKNGGNAVLFAFRMEPPWQDELPLLYLPGLDPQARYQIEGLPDIRSGLGWRHTGIQLGLGNMQSTMRRIRRVG